MKRLLPLLLFFTSCFTLAAQRCGTDEYHKWMMETDANYRAAYENKELLERNYTNASSSSMRSGGCAITITIPVVVHIVHKGEPIGVGSNIPDSIVHQTIAGLNEYYSGQSYGTQTHIQFVLAKRDPNGSATSGINRVNGSVVSDYYTNGIRYTSNCGANANAIKDLSRWPTDKYYNIWVVHSICTPGIAAFAALPVPGNAYDGAVVARDYFSYYNSTLAHEIGHGLNLYHTFEGDGNGSTCPLNNNCLIDGDRVCDTPPHRRDDCNIGQNPCSNDQANLLNSVYNIMSYCFPQYLDMRFSNGQLTRMHDAIVNLRPWLYNNENTIPPNSVDLLSIKPADSTFILPCAGLKNIGFIVFNYSNSTINQADIRIEVNSQFVKYEGINSTVLPGGYIYIYADSVPLNTGINTITATLENYGANDDYMFNNTTCFSIVIPSSTSSFPSCYFQPDVGYLNLFYFPSRKYRLANGYFTYSAWSLGSGQTCGPNGYNLKFPNQQGLLYYGNYQTDSLRDYDFYINPVYVAAEDTTVLSFYTAAKYPYSNNSYLELDIQASTDCGETWVSLYNKNNISSPITVGGITYNPTTESVCNMPYNYPNGAPETPSFSPLNCSQWRKEYIGLGQFEGQEVLLNFKARKFDDNGLGECIYLDDICIKNCAPKYADLNYTINEGDSVVVGSSVYKEQGVYTTILQTVQGCDSIVTTTLTVLVGLQNNTVKTFNIYPNPASEQAIIVFGNTQARSITLFNAVGQVVYAHTTADKQAILSIGGLAKGVYIITVQTNKGSTSQKLIKN